MIDKLLAAIGRMASALVRAFGPKRDDPKRAPKPPVTSGPKRDDPK